MTLTGAVSIITGAAQGIGRAIADGLAREGSVVVISDVNEEKAAEAVGEIVAGGGRAHAVTADISRRADIERLIGGTVTSFGRIDILVNNAGVSEPRAFIDMSEDEWDRVIDINLKAPFLCSQAAATHMIRNSGGRIINIASVVSTLAHPTQAAYCASKAGLVLLTKVLAAELAEHGITVNAVSPGAVETARSRRFRLENPDFLRGRVEATPLGRMIQPEEVARLVVFLASPESEAITGANLVIDGGSSAIWAAALPQLRPRQWNATEAT